MTATYPESRRAIAANEFAHAAPDLAGSVRALMDWQNYTYNSDLRVSPWDTKIFAADDWHWQVTGEADEPQDPSPNRTVSSGTTELRVGHCVMMPPRIVTAGVKVWAWVELSATNSVGKVEITNDQTGVVTEIAVTYAACGDTLTGAWLSADVTCGAYDPLTIRAKWTSGGTVTVAGLSVYWVPTTLASASWSALSQNWAAADRPDSRYALRWLADSCNRFMEQRAPLQVMASYSGDWAVGNTTGYTASRTVVGRYKVLVGEKITALRIYVFGKKEDGSNNCTLLVNVDGVTKHTFTFSSSTYGWQNASLSLTGGTAAAAVDVSLEWGEESGSAILVPAVSIWEETATLTLPGAEAVPANFTANDNGGTTGTTPITAASRATLIANTIWLWKNRGLRMLVCDSRYSSRAETTASSPADAVFLIDSDHDIQARRQFSFLGGTKVPRFHQAWYGWWPLYFNYDNFNTFPPIRWPEWSWGYAWTDETGSKASAATLSRVQHLSDLEGYVPTENGLVLGGIWDQFHVPVVTTSPPWLAAAAAEQVYDTFGEPAPQLGDGPGYVYPTRTAGVCIEELPLNATAGTRT